MELLAEEVVYNRSFTRLQREAGKVFGREVHWRLLIRQDMKASGNTLN